MVDLVSAVTPNPTIPCPSFDIDLPSLWEDVSSLYSSSATSSEKSFRENVSRGRVASPMNKIRLFGDDTEADIRVTFYR